MSTHGVIVTPTLKTTGEGVNFNAFIETDALRRLLFYWDYITYMVMGIGPNIKKGTDMSFLEQERILRLQDVDIPEIYPKDFVTNARFVGIPMEYYNPTLLEAQMRLAKSLNERGERHSIALFGDLPELGAPPPARIIELELYRCLPAPREDASLGDIIDFRVKYASELQTLRDEVARLKTLAATSKDPEVDYRETLEKLREVSTSVASSMKASGISAVWSTIKTAVSEYSSAVGSTEVIERFVPLPDDLRNIIELSVAGLRVARRIATAPPRVPAELAPYTYLFRAADEL
jgi:hypothetical protein